MRWLIWVSWLVAGAEQGSMTAAAAGNFVDMGGAKIWYEECGANSDGDNEVLLHGSVKRISHFPVQVLAYGRSGMGARELTARTKKDSDPCPDATTTVRTPTRRNGLDRRSACSDGGLAAAERKEALRRVCSFKAKGSCESSGRWLREGLRNRKMQGIRIGSHLRQICV